MSLLRNPTQAFSQSQFYQNYLQYKQKLFDLNTNNCLDDVINDFETMFEKYTNALEGIYNTLTNAVHCVSKAFDSQELSNVHTEMINASDKILNGETITSVLQAIDQAENSGDPCNYVNMLRNEINNAISKADSLINALSQYTDLANELSRYIMKATSLISCFKGNISSFERYVDTFDPNFVNVAKQIDQSRSIDEALRNAMQEIKNVSNMDNRLRSITNMLKV